MTRNAERSPCELQAFFERRGGARKVAAPHRQVGELIQRSRVAGIQLSHPLEAGPRLIQLSGVLIGQRQAPRRAFVLRVDRQRLLVRGDRVGQPVRLDVHVAEHRVGFDDLGVGREDLPDFRDPVVELAVDGVLRGALEQVVEADLVLRVATKPVGQRRAADRRRHVPERPEPFFHFGFDRSRLLRRRRDGQFRRHVGEGTLQRVGHARVRRRDVVQLAGIGLGVVELPARRRDELVAAVANRGQLAPAVVIARIPGLAVAQKILPLAAAERHQADALHGRRRRDAGQFQDRGHHVDDAYLVGDGAGRHARSGDDQRNAYRRVVDEEAVLLLAVFAQRFAVVAHDDNHGVRQAAAAGEKVDEPADLRVGGGDLSVVRPLERRRKARAIGLGRHVRAVRIVEMHPREKRLVAFAGQPGQRVVDHLAARALRRVEPGGHFKTRQIEVVVVVVESLRDAPPVVEDVGPDESARAIAVCLQHLGQRRDLVADVEAAVVAHAMEGRERAGEQRRVGRQRQRRDRFGLLEAQAPGGEGVDHGGGRGPVAVAPDVVGPQGVDAHQQDRRPAGARPSNQPAVSPAKPAGGETDGHHHRHDTPTHGAIVSTARREVAAPVRH